MTQPFYSVPCLLHECVGPFCKATQASLSVPSGEIQVADEPDSVDHCLRPCFDHCRILLEVKGHGMTIDVARDIDGNLLPANPDDMDTALAVIQNREFIVALH
jgi:hypothetical protein